ncbi:MAG: sigma factor-like helix-turn-helix DNA-binding protein [Xanthomarina gelatinilytica]|uniref:sigma factor-like helix-turn-helix DNA-binding protein n=1 Tax=Xanthomarina gelatinilytica TaxID=1137281 RepID=UPI003A8655EA
MKTYSYDVPQDIFIRYQKAFEQVLDARHYEILRLRVEDGLGFSEIAKLYGLSTEYIRQCAELTFETLEQTGYVGKRVISK